MSVFIDLTPSQRLKWLLTSRPDKFDADDPAVRIEIGDEHFATRRLIVQVGAVMRLPVYKSQVADLLSDVYLWHCPVMLSTPASLKIGSNAIAV